MCDRCCAHSGIYCGYHQGRFDPEEEDDSDDESNGTSMICSHGECRRMTQTWCPNGMCDRCCAHSGIGCGYHQGRYDEDDDDEEEEDTTTEYAGEAQNAGSDDTTTHVGGEDEEEDTTTWHPQQHTQWAVSCSTGDCNNRPAADCQNHMCGRCCVLFGQYNCQRHHTGSYAN